MFKLLLILLVISVIYSCQGDCLSIQENKVRELLNKNLSLSDSREKIEQEIQRLGVSFTYDRFQNRYQATIRDGCSPYEAISVYLNLDGQEKLSTIVVFKSYTGS